MQDRDHTFTIAYKGGSKDTPQLFGGHADLVRATDLAKLTSLFSADLTRDLNITFIIDDLPAVMLAYAERDRMVELSEQGECESYFPTRRRILLIRATQITDRQNSLGMTIPTSPTLLERVRVILPYDERSEPNSLPITPERRHDLSSGIILAPQISASIPKRESCTVTRCNKESLSRLSSRSSLSPKRDFTPIFSLRRWSSTPSRIPSTNRSGITRARTSCSGEVRRNFISLQNCAKFLAAGSTTGVEFNRHTPWKMSQRARLHLMSQDVEGDRSVIWSQRGAVRESNMSISDLNHLYMDTSFSGEPHQCDPETCALMAKTLTFKKTIGLVESNTVRSFRCSSYA